ncbi:unnamed protein product [Parnassius apollo]|uniref:Regulatory protein zeste n=1 Tax=Parnassius apollo TaxID=110799 RepID=A0A8S3W3M8_PARAO|nr:unnamed protein product [Parnassius apollo]
MPKRRNVTSSEQKIPAKDDGSVPERPLKLRKQNRPLEDKEICENLTNESDDNCSDFDDDVGDPDFILESDHNTESEQSDEDDVDVTYPHVEEVYHGEINHNHDNEEQEREVRAHGSQDITEQIGKETIVGEEQHGAAETIIEEIEEEQYSEVETRNDQGSEDLRIDQEPNEESTGELPRYFYGKNRYKWASAEPYRTSRVRVHNIVNAPSQQSDDDSIEVLKPPVMKSLHQNQISHQLKGLVRCEPQQDRSFKRRKNLAVSQNVDRMIETIGNKICEIAADDKFDAFGKNVAHKLRSLPTNQRLFAEKIINDALFEAELESEYKKTWLNLRESHRRAMKKRKTKSDQAAPTTKKWTFEDDMSFLVPHYKERNTISSVDYDDDSDVSLGLQPTSAFNFDNLVTRNACFLDECRLTDNQFKQWKLLAGGQTMNTEQKRSRVSYEQREKMFEFMVAHPDFARNRVAGADAARRKLKLQTELATILNNCATVATKSAEKWIKCWQDWRSDVKSKAAKIRRAQQQTGGEPEPAPLSAMEESLMAFIAQQQRALPLLIP